MTAFDKAWKITKAKCENCNVPMGEGSDRKLCFTCEGEIAGDLQ